MIRIAALILLALSAAAHAQPLPEFDTMAFCKWYIEEAGHKYPGLDDKLGVSVCQVSEAISRDAILRAWDLFSAGIRHQCLERFILTHQRPSYEALGGCLEAEEARSHQGPARYSFFPQGSLAPADRNLTLPECSARAKGGGTCIGN
jgi:hypothetical protein